MKTITLYIGILFLAIASCPTSIFAFSSVPNQEETIIRHGYLDLRNWDFRQNGFVNLDGQWRIFWNQLLTPADLEKISDLEKARWIKVPGAWNDDTYDGATLPGNGVATYTLLIDLPEFSGTMALRLKDIFTAYRLYVEDKLVAEVGVVSDDETVFTPRFEPRIVYIDPNQSRIRLTLQIANFAMPHGGPFHVPQLGSAEAITDQSKKSGYVEMLLFGLLLMMSLYHFGLFSLRRDDPSTLLFGLFCLDIAIRALFTGERIGFNFFFDWPVAFRIDILTIYLGIPLFYMFFKTIYPNHMSNKLVGFTLILALINMIFVLFTPANFYIHLLLPNHVIVVCLVVYVIYCLILEIKAKSEGAGLALAGLCLSFLTVVNDILVSNRIIFTPYLISFGVFIFILVQSFLLSIRFSKAFSEVKKYSDDLQQEVVNRIKAEKKLQKSHDNLEVEIEKRTYEIRKAMESAEQSNKLKSEFLANMSHELRNPMHQIMSYSQYGILKIQKPREKLLHYFSQTRKAAERLMVLLNDLLDLSKHEAGKMDYNIEICNINSLILEVAAEYKQVFTDRNLKLELSGLQKPIRIFCDPFKIEQVIRNLLANSIKYRGESREIRIVVNQTTLNIQNREQAAIAFSIKDSGVGIPENELETIFDKFTQSSFTKTGAGGTGLGLAICREIIEAHQGIIWAFNNKNSGATFKFILPLNNN